MPEKSKNKAKKEALGLIWCIVVALAIAAIIFLFIGNTIRVEGSSMANTLYNGDRIIISNLSYAPKARDIVVFEIAYEGFRGATFVKRVIATEGQEVSIVYGHVYVDGILQCEPHIRQPVNREDLAPIIIEENHVFVMGDNRDHSIDSRDGRVGQIHISQIKGRALFILIPAENELGIRELTRFGIIEDLSICLPGQNCVCDHSGESIRVSEVTK